MDTWKRFNDKELTHSMAHYLQAIASLKGEKGHARVGDIAERLGVSKSGVTSMLHSLQTRGLVEHERYGYVELTGTGSRLAELTETNRKVLTMFFTDILGVSVPTGVEDACMIEHLVSPEAMLQFLRLTALIRSDHPAAREFRDVFRNYQQSCESGTAGATCPVCKGACLHKAFRGLMREAGPAVL
jgi:DtxR family Mn-dependent transcriptional regulator